MYQFESFAVSIKSQVLVQPQALNLPDPGLVLLVGTNGVGKTTFLKHLAGVFLKKNKKISFVSSIQVYERGLSLRGEEFCKLYSTPPWPIAVHEKFYHLRSKRIDQMSSGEFQALVLISNFTETSEVLLIDEPLSHLSQEWSDFFIHWLSEIKKSKLVLVASHQIDEFSEVSDQIYELKDQKLNLLTVKKGEG